MNDHLIDANDEIVECNVIFMRPGIINNRQTLLLFLGPRPNEIKKHVLMPTFLRHIFYRDWLCKMNAVVKLKSKRIVHEYMRKRTIKPLTKVCQEGDLVIQHSRGSSRVALESNFFKIPWLLQE